MEKFKIGDRIRVKADCKVGGIQPGTTGQIVRACGIHMDWIVKLDSDNSDVHLYEADLELI